MRTNTAAMRLFIEHSVPTSTKQKMDDSITFMVSILIYLSPLTYLESLRLFSPHTKVTTGSLNPDPTLTALGLPLDGNTSDTYESVIQTYQDVVSQINSAALDDLMNEEYRQAGTIVRTSDEYFASEQGQQCGKIGLYECFRHPDSNQPPSWWPEHDSIPSSPKRPLAGLKVVDLTRIIAGPAITRSLAEMGASVMRVTSPHITDISIFHQDLNWGKWNCHLHLEDQADREALKQLIREADVVVDGYRPGVMERHGFGHQDILKLVQDRDYGIIHVRENCYGWHGPWSHRSGWQQISDAVRNLTTHSDFWWLAMASFANMTYANSVAAFPPRSRAQWATMKR